MSLLSYDVRLVEETVCLAAGHLPPEGLRFFRRERDRIYELRDERTREAEFRRLHGRWFARLGLGGPVERALAAYPAVAAGVRLCQVIPAVSRKEELADLRFDPSGSSYDETEAADRSSRPLLVLRLRPESFLDAERLLTFLHHEFLHVADMLDPTFGYQDALPCSDDGPAYDNILRNRYRVLWDTTIDGRLARAGLASPRAREIRQSEFASTFPELHPSLTQEFARWFDGPRPMHQEIAAFVLTRRPPFDPSQSADGRCPVCRFPVATLDPHLERLSAGARRSIQTTHPSWEIRDGLCRQCADLYEVRFRES